MTAKMENAARELFRISDELRDDILPFIGIRLEDKGEGNESIVKFDDPERLIKKRQQAIEEKLKKEEEKRLRKEMELKKKSTPPKDWFRVMEADKYS